MRVSKNVNNFFLILPKTPVSIPDALSSFLLAILKLVKISLITKEYLCEKLGFPLNIVEALLHRLMQFDLLEETDSEKTYQITDLGNKRLKEGQISIEREIDVRLQVTDFPHFVLTPHWYSIPREAEEVSLLLARRITRSTLIQRAKYSNLDQRIRSLPNEPEVIGISKAQLSFHLTAELPRFLFARDKTGRDHPIRIKHDDPTINDLHSSLWARLNPENFNRTLENAILESPLASSINLKVEDPFEDYCTMSMKFKKENLAIEDHLALVKWLKENNWDFQQFKASFVIYDGWELVLDVELQVSDERILWGMFCVHLTKNEPMIYELIESNDFMDTLNKQWSLFIEKYSLTTTLDLGILFDILWKLGTSGKILAGRIIEREVINNGRVV